MTRREAPSSSRMPPPRPARPALAGADPGRRRRPDRRSPGSPAIPSASAGRPLIGVVCFLGVAAACSADLRRVNWRTVAAGLALQLVLAVLILRVRRRLRPFEAIGPGDREVPRLHRRGGGVRLRPAGQPRDGRERRSAQDDGFIFAFKALPAVIFVSSFFTVLYYLGVLQFVVRVFARVMVLVFGGTSGAETLSATANVFMGQTEAPLIVKPYVARMTKSELLALMVGGMATISGGVMVVYIGMGADPVAILATSVMAAPCGLYLAKILLPETEEPETRGQVKLADERPHANVIDAAADGASEGMKLVLNIAAMLIAFIAFIALINYLLGTIGPGIRHARSLSLWSGSSRRCSPRSRS